MSIISSLKTKASLNDYEQYFVDEIELFIDNDRHLYNRKMSIFQEIQKLKEKEGNYSAKIKEKLLSFAREVRKDYEAEVIDIKDFKKGATAKAYTKIVEDLLDEYKKKNFWVNNI